MEIELSLIVPVYNRPDEIDELLESLSNQTCKEFEVVVVEDGSTKKCDKIIENYEDVLNIKYFYKENSGPGQSRNYGFEHASGNYCVFLDSDCVIPPEYIDVVLNNLANSYTDAFGGPDKAHKDFSNIQKAINYAMTSFFTTGGIRGGGEKLDKFYPRSFNMGYSREVFTKTGGFSKMRFGEDIDMSIRILSSGFKTKLIKEAYVYHKRRTNFRQFYKQIHNSGIARINLYKLHPESLKLVHTLPTFFLLGLITILFLSVIWSVIFIAPVVFFIVLVFIDSTIQNKSISIGFISVLTSFIQLIGYGLGFIRSFWKRIVLSKGEFSAFKKNFYK
jgi:glycosyltransferase involved in cell wall biosynthesis